MAALSGTAGSVVYMTGGTTNVGEIAEWRLDLSMSPQEVTSFGDNWQDYVPSVRNATGTFSGNFDTSDSAQTSLTNAMLGGSAVALRLYLSGTKYFNVGTAYLTGMAPGISQKGKGDIQWSFQNSAAVTLV
jgi:hypothetical protein